MARDMDIKLYNYTNMDIKVKVGKRIEELKQKAGLTNRFLGWDADLDPSYIISVVKGEKAISAIALEKICIALKISMKEFFNHPDFDE